MANAKTRPLWYAKPLPQFPRLTSPASVDVVVVGGGITGLSAAYQLKRAGKTVCLLEKERIGSGDTGHTTAHLTCVTDVRLTQLVKSFGRDEAALVWFAGLTAIETIEQTVRELAVDCQFRRVPGFLHAALYGKEDESADLRNEADLAAGLGFDAHFVSAAPIVGKPAMQISNQAKLRPLEYLAALAAFVEGDGSAVYEQSEVTEVDNSPLAVVANGVRIECGNVVIATQVPLQGKAGMLSAALSQTKLAPYSTYVVSARLPLGSAPEVSLWDTSDPYYYLRIDKEADCDRVIFGGNDHKTGQADDTVARYTRLEKTLHELLPAAVVDHRWSGQVIDTNDGLPLIGEAVERQFVASGFNGNGMTFATVAGMILRDAILGKENPFAELFSVDRKKIRGGAWDYVKENLDYPYYLIADRLHSPKVTTVDEIANGQGEILKIDGKKVACARDSHGRLHQVSAVCTHLGCLVRWNAAEQTWDCPCHGSRFKPTGEVLAGPAETPLAPVETGATIKERAGTS